MTQLRAARQARGWSQARLQAALRGAAQEAGIKLPGEDSLKTQLSRWENGHRIPNDFYRQLFRRIYGLTDRELGFATTRSDAEAAYSRSTARVPSIVSFELIDSLTATLGQLSRTDSLAGPVPVLAAATDQADFVGRLCQVSAGPERHDLLALATRFAEFIGWLHQDDDDLTQAMQWTDRAMDYSQELGDPRLISYVLMRKSNILTDGGHSAQGRGLADAALRASGELTPRLRALALRQRANAFALLGEADGCARELDLAMDEVNREPVDLNDDFLGYCGPSYVEMEAANCWLQLEQPGKAIPIFESSLGNWPIGHQPRDRGLCLARLATAHAIAGDLDRAAQAGVESLITLRIAGSGRVLNQLRQLRMRLAPAYDSPSVAAFGRAYVEQFGTTHMLEA